MKPQGFAYWLSSKTLPDARIASFERLTNLKVNLWAQPYEQFCAAVQREAGEVTSWMGLVGRAKVGQIKVHVEGDAPPRFQPVGAPDDGARPTAAWLGCRAWVELPKRKAGRWGDERWCCWLIADYSEEIFILDPALSGDGRATQSSLRSGVQRLPRGAPGFVTLSGAIAVGRSFDVVVLLINLRDQAGSVADAFGELENKSLLVPLDGIFSKASHAQIRAALDEAATLLQQHAVEHEVHRQPCQVVPAPVR